jgi:hypothetical protein
MHRLETLAPRFSKQGIVAVHIGSPIVVPFLPLKKVMMNVTLQGRFESLITPRF